MSLFDNLKEQIKSLGTRLGEQIQESSAYEKAQDRYENLSPSGQKLAIAGAVSLVLIIVLFIPLTNFFDSQGNLNRFEEKRNLIRDLFKTYRESASSSNLAIPPSSEALRTSVNSIIERAELTPEQNLGTTEIAAEGRLIPQNIVTLVLQVKLAKLNLKQIVDIGSSLTAISESVKMKDLQIIANSQDTRYFDVTYKLYSLKVPEPVAPPPPEPALKNKKNKELGNE